MATIDDRVASLETKVAVQEVKMEGLATKADLQAMVNDFKSFLIAQLDPVKKDLEAVKSDVGVMKNELTHKASHADVANAVINMTWRMIGQSVAIIGVLGGLMALFKFLH